VNASITPPTKFMVEHRKIVHYLLNLDHPDGKAKAEFFLARGFSLSDLSEFAHSLLDHPLRASSSLTEFVPDVYAPRFVYEGGLLCPDRTQPRVRTIWELKGGETHGRLVTAFPCRS
jgi:hypothetical protein